MGRLTDKRIAEIIAENGGNFRPEEFLEGRENLSEEIIAQVVAFRKWTGYPTLITSAYRPSGSLTHSRGLAIDFVMFTKWRQKQPDPRELWIRAYVWNFTGVGIYFDWSAFGRPVVGLHADVLRGDRRRPARWIRDEGDYYFQSFADGIFYNNDLEFTRAATLSKMISKFEGSG